VIGPVVLPADCGTMIRACDIELARRGDLLAWLRLAWPGYKTPRHIRYLTQKLEQVECGEIRRLIIAKPPRHGKSMCVSGWIARILARSRQKYVMHASYGQEFIDGWGRKIRRIIEGAAREVWPSTQAGTSRAANCMELSNGCEYYAVGRGGPATGRGAHFLILDDMLKDRQEADSEAIIKVLIEWYSEVAYTRLMPGGAVVIIATRWSVDDLTGWLLKNHPEEGWEVVSMPAIAEAGDLIGRQPGEALWPEEYPVSRLMEIKSQLTNEQGSRAWGALFQQNPIPAAGAMFRREWFRRFQLPLVAAPVEITLASWDTANKDNEVHDWRVGQIWKRTPDGCYMVDRQRGHYDYPTLRRVASAQIATHVPHCALIEDKGTGTALIADLRECPEAKSGKTRIVAVDPGNRSKVMRAQGVSPMVEAGRVWIPEGVAFGDETVAEAASFPWGKNDDDVDAMSQALEFLRTAGSIDIMGDNLMWAAMPTSGAM